MRRFGTLGLILILIVASLGIFAVIQQLWVLSLVLGFVALAGTSLLVLVCTRYVVRLLRTQERKSRMASNALADRFDEAQDKVETLMLNHRSQIEAVDDTVKTYNKKFSELNSKLHKAARASSNHVTQTVRHSTTELEALLQIYSRFSDMKLPMPSTGGWALDARSLAHLMALVEDKRPLRILELGSGTSTIWLGYLCRAYGGQVITLDHLEQYLDQTRAAIHQHKLGDYVQSRLAPLEEISCDGEVYEWYSREALADLLNIDMVLVDGPPAATGPKARYPALPMVNDRLSPNATVVLDDAHRPDEMDIVAQWQSRFPEFKRTVLDTTRLAVLSRTAE